MRYQTRDFGAVELEESKTIEFVQPIFGFEEYRKFTLLFDEEIGRHITWLQSLEEPSLCFILMDPDVLATRYVPAIPDEVEALLGSGEYACWVLAAIRDSVQTASVNLKSPVLVNMVTRRGMQLMLDQEYPVHYLLSKEAQQGEC